MNQSILVLNAGSSSIKFQMFDASTTDLRQSLKGQMEGIGTKPRLTAKDADGATIIDQSYAVADIADVRSAIEVLRVWLGDYLAGDLPFAVGHRVVHGGPKFERPVLIDADVVSQLERYISLAPLHQPSNLLPIKTILDDQPQMQQVACFDTAFHRTHGELADRFAIPETLYEEGVRRYGFHGLSYEYIARTLPELAPGIAKGRVVVAHLGSGASLCALEGGQSADSTMGFTALDGLAMGTRPGQLDPLSLIHI